MERRTVLSATGIALSSVAAGCLDDGDDAEETDPADDAEEMDPDDDAEETDPADDAEEMDPEDDTVETEPDDDAEEPRPDASVDVSFDAPDAVELTLTDRESGTVVVLEGAEVSDPDEYRLEESGESRSITTDDVGTGTIEVVATRDAAEDGNEVETFSLSEPDDWTDVSEVVLEGRTEAWVGVEPAHIEGKQNPSLVFEAGETYEITISSGDGAEHNLGLRDADGDLVEDYETDLTADGEETLSFTATGDIDAYTCERHDVTMYGEVLVLEDLDD